MFFLYYKYMVFNNTKNIFNSAQNNICNRKYQSTLLVNIFGAICERLVGSASSFALIPIFLLGIPLQYEIWNYKIRKILTSSVWSINWIMMHRCWKIQHLRCFWLTKRDIRKINYNHVSVINTSKAVVILVVRVCA